MNIIIAAGGQCKEPRPCLPTPGSIPGNRGISVILFIGMKRKDSPVQKKYIYIF
jgi:hypothetical protein